MITERRAVLAGIVAAAAAPGLARRGVRVSLETPSDRLRTFMLMRGALDDRLVVGCLSGVYLGCVTGISTPLFGFVSATFARYRAQPDGSYEGVSLEQAYFVDLATGEWLQRFANPYTGRTVDVPTGAYPPGRIQFKDTLEMRLPDAPPGQALSHQVSDFRLDGRHVWLTETTAGVTPSHGESPLQYREVVGLHARAGEIAAPDAKQVLCETSYTAIKSWRPWLDMGDHPGETVSTGHGMYGATVNELPLPWLTAARRHRPELLADPIQLLEPLWREKNKARKE